MNWGIKLTLVIVVFIALMAIMVVYSFRQDLNMVTDNYYEKDLQYQEQIEKIKNTQSLIEKPKVLYRSTDKLISITFPERIYDQDIEGEIQLFRPSDHNMDKSYKISLDEYGHQAIHVAALSRGEWYVKLMWTDLHDEFYDEVKIFIR